MEVGCRFYRNANGGGPGRDWVKSLGKELMKEIGSDIRRVQLEWPVSKPLVDGLGGGLYEVRTKVERIQYRVFFCLVDSTMVLLHGCVKKARTVPADIKLARQRQKEVEA